MPLLEREVVLRGRDDEDRHARLFTTLAEVAGRIAAIGESFLPRARRRSLTVGNPLGSDGPVQVLHGETGADRRALFRQLLVECVLLLRPAPPPEAGVAEELFRRRV